MTRKTIVIASLILLPLMPGCAGPKDRVAPNVILISLDTTRADHLGCYGHDGIKTPAIDGLAQRSLRFERCFAAVPITLPSHTSILSGRYPIRHSVRDNGTFTVPADLPTLATLLGKRGWRTIGVVGAYPLTERFGLARGFQIWDEELTSRQDEMLALAFDQRPANEVTDAALRRVEGAGDEPFFLFVHYFDPHRPWTAPGLYGRRYRNSPYDAEIAFTDASVGRLLDELDERGHLDNAIVVLTADHGEGFKDHEEETHSYLLFNETTRVPLLLSGPGVEPGVVEEPVSSVDIAPTILEMVGIGPPDSIDGISLLSGPPDDRLIYIESLAGRLHHGWNDVRGAVVNNNKYIFGQGTLLFDLETDMAERNNLVDEDPEIAEDIDRCLIDFIAANQGTISLADAFTMADDDVIRQLEALGYAIPDVEHRQQDWSELGPVTPEGDPRRLIEMVEIQSLARQAINQGEIPVAMETIETGLASHTEDIELLRLLLIARLRVGDAEGAAEASQRLQRVSRHEPRDDALVALAALVAGDFEAALMHAERAAEVSGDPHDRLLHARVLAAADRPDEARTIMTGILDQQPCETATLRELAKLERLAGNRGKLEPTYRTIRECAPADPSPLVNLGNLAVERGDLAAAEALYLEAIELRPGYALGHYSLGVVLNVRGDLAAAHRSLETALARAPINSPVGRKAAVLLDKLEAPVDQ